MQFQCCTLCDKLTLHDISATKKELKQKQTKNENKNKTKVKKTQQKLVSKNGHAKKTTTAHTK